MPKVTIGLPCYNEAPFIEETVRSLLAQTDDDFELLICDNGSNDGTLEIIRRVTEGDSRVVIHPSEKNMGAPANFLRAFDLASSPYFMWMGAHDVIAKDYVKKLRLVLDADADCCLAYADSIYIAKDGSDIPGERIESGLDLSSDSALERFKTVLWQLIRCDMFNGLIRRDLISRKIVESTCRAPDIVLLADLALRGKFRRVPELMFFRRRNRETEDGLTWQKRLAAHGCGDASQSILDSWTVLRDEHLPSIATAPVSPRERHEMRLVLFQVFMERHAVPWDASLEEATVWEKLKMRFSSDASKEMVRQRIRQRVAARVRIEDASSKARMERELVSLLKENHRLRKELAKAKK